MRARSALLIAIAALALPGTAGAATVETSATAGPSAEPYIVYTASKGERNRVQVSIAGEHVVIVDSGASRIRVGDTYFGKCRATGRRRVVCDRLDIEAELGDGNDSITFAPGAAGKPPDRRSGLPFAIERSDDDEGEILETAIVVGGTGDDRIAGTRFADYVIPGPGRDVVDARDGADYVDLPPDGVPDAVRGGGGADVLSFAGPDPVKVDLRAGSARARGVRDTVAGFETVMGSRGDDTLRGTDVADALYGEQGADRLEGRGGDDVLVGGESFGDNTGPDTFAGGGGDDYVDAGAATTTAPSTLDCGPGSDTTFAELDDRLDPTCELATHGEVDPYYRPHLHMRAVAWPTGRTSEGDPIYSLDCPGNSKNACEGRVELRSTDAVPTTYGSGAFSGRGGETLRAAVVLNDAGRAAVAARSPVAVEVSFGSAPPATVFGWQQVLPVP